MANNLLSINDLSKKEILELIEFANNFFNDEGSFRRESLFPDKTIANVFCEPSTRTKSSFAIAAKNLGWDQIAVSIVDLNSDDALAFALADNRISDLGSTDADALYEAISSVAGTDADFFDLLGWDEFAVAVIENEVIEIKDIHN